MKPVDRVHVLFCLSIHSVEAPVLSEVFHRGILEQNSDHGLVFHLYANPSGFMETFGSK